ncbi:TetR/AcrR family transcriptional regulator [Pseudoalteromonas sp. C2R02]|uniref:TetR/AcrR family transcriptional regulator n=1 Tax=Pseudoalteromonas sp. C2R02 TaxID=2841565 RepID=UPI001C0A0CB8|nr:TetR/AcrR family transcriptional regulator [Pseudoalteromonas sp. C2R02]MBU2972505.1 TetR/AcrR family transcriptional regulator [Pseudoalteromonas sp. C2R02]
MDKKQQIMDVAIELFAKRGYENTPISAICKHSNVSKGLAFHHFENKEGLLREVFLRMAQIIEEVGDNVDLVNEELSTKERFVSHLEKIFLSMTCAEHKLYYQFDFQVLCQPALRTLLKDLFDERYQLMLESFQSILNDIPSADSLVDSHMLIAELDGIALNYLFAEDEYPLTKIKQRFIKKHLLLLGL